MFTGIVEEIGRVRSVGAFVRHVPDARSVFAGRAEPAVRAASVSADSACVARHRETVYG